MKKIKIPFFLQIISILLAGVLLSFLSYNTVRWIKADKHTVTFAYQDGTIIACKKVIDGFGVNPDFIKTEDVFRGWNAAINCVEQDIEVHPLIYAITDEENMFYFNSVYVIEGNDFSLELKLAGNINFNYAELALEYDKEVMQYIGSKNGAICTVIDNEDGSLTIKAESEKTVTEEQLLSELKFKALENDVQSTEVALKCKNIYFDSDNGQKPVTGTTLGNKVYYLQKTGWIWNR